MSAEADGGAADARDAHAAAEQAREQERARSDASGEHDDADGGEHDGGARKHEDEEDGEDVEDEEEGDDEDGEHSDAAATAGVATAGASTSRAAKRNYQRRDLPLSRVKRIARLDPDVRLISGDAALALAVATENFVTMLMCEAYEFTRRDKRKIVQLRDVGKAVHRVDQFEFLQGMFSSE